MKWNMGIWRLGLVTLVLTLTVAGCGTVSRGPTPPPANDSAVAGQVNNPVDPGSSLHGRPAPDFTLTDQFGKTISLHQFRGKVVVLAFVDSECTTICPLTTQSMTDALKQLGPTAAKDVQLLGIDANPTATSVSDVRTYSQAHNLVHSWHFLTGSLAQLKTVWHDYYIYTGIVNGQIDHTPALYIIDPQGHEQFLYLTPSQYGAVSAQASVLAHDIARFLPVSVRPNLTSIPYHQPTFGVGSQIRLPEVTASGSGGSGGTATIGPGKPQLLVFFASWVPQIEQDLKQLNTYVLGSNHPEVVGIDVGSTEPSPTSIQPLLRQEGTLHFPIVQDESGNVADTYQVQDLVWLTLTDGKGHIIWSHDGYLPASQLGKQITAALQKAKVVTGA